MALRQVLLLVVVTTTTIATTRAQQEEFVPNFANRTCSGDVHSRPWIDKIIGVNIGGWMVLEPWLTPSLFYQFLGKRSYETAMDTHSFCSVLGGEEANFQLRRHWRTWVSENHVQRLASLGINSLRVPVGDWLYEPYEPYVKCFEGGREALDQLLGWARKYDLKVLLDVHAVRRSANGLDNGGITMGVKWTSTLADVASDAVTFEHWPRRSAAWMGDFDKHTGTYTPEVNWTRLEETIEVLEAIASAHHNDTAVLGVEAVNEPWQFSPIEDLKEFYWQAYLRVKKIAPHWRFVMHDSFRFNVETWGGFMRGCPDVAMDTHIYQAWFEPSVRANFYANACAQKDIISKMEAAFGPVIVGEWSLATDNCAMWINGFNDNLPGYPKLPCKFIRCVEPYVGVDVQPNAPPSVLKPLQGPFGTGVSGPLYGLCPVDRDWGPASPADLGSFQRQPSDLDAEAEVGHDETNEVMTQLARKKLQAFALVAHGFYFWNFRTELEDQWSYLRAVDRGWMPTKMADLRDEITHACDNEDVHCRTDPDASDAQILAAAEFAAGYDPDECRKLHDLSSAALRHAADQIFDAYWIAHRDGEVGVDSACDFGGAAGLTQTPYKCLARRVEEKATRDGMAYCVGFDPDAIARFDTLHADDLYAAADVVFDDYWKTHRYEGTTCDFGGGAILVAVTVPTEMTTPPENQNSLVSSLSVSLRRSGHDDDHDALVGRVISSSRRLVLALFPTLALILLVAAWRRGGAHQRHHHHREPSSSSYSSSS